jgi:hypothetical protein
MDEQEKRYLDQMYGFGGEDLNEDLAEIEARLEMLIVDLESFASDIEDMKPRRPTHPYTEDDEWARYEGALSMYEDIRENFEIIAKEWL